MFPVPKENLETQTRHWPFDLGFTTKTVGSRVSFKSF